MVIGHAYMIERTHGVTWESLRAEFRWPSLARFNIATACVDVHAATSLALIDIAGGDIREYTFGYLADQSKRLANGLASLGVTRGERVGIMLPQGLDVAVSHLATYRLGAVALPLTQLFGPDAVRHRLGDSQARVVITDATCIDLVAEVTADLADVQVVVAADEVARPHHRLADLVDNGAARHEVAATGPDDPALLIYTSGTTGSPKGALHGHRVLLGHLPGFELMFDFFPQADDRMWTPADWAWIGGLLDAVFPAWYHGRPVVAARRGGFDPQWAADLIDQHHVSATFLPPTALKLMRQAEVSARNTRLRTVMSGGEPLGAEMLAWGRDHLGVTINEIYGQTEANLLIGNSASVWEVRSGSMGRAYPGHDLAILAPDGGLAAAGSQGEIIVRSPDPVMMLGYFNRPDATADKYMEVVDDDGVSAHWLRTGDVGQRDEDGWFWFTARDDDVISSAGYRIGPAEIEECIMGHPSVGMVAVVGVPDDLRGEVVKAFVVPREDVEASEELSDEIRQLVRTQLAAYEYPRDVEFVTSLPMTTTGKILRRDLRDREIAERARK